MVAEFDKSKDHKEFLLDFFLHAPIGLLYEFSDLYPEAVKRGKSQVQIGKLLAQMASDKGKSNLEESIQDLVKESAGFLSIIAERLENLYPEDVKSTKESSTKKSTSKKSTSSKKATAKKSVSKASKAKKTKAPKKSVKKASSKKDPVKKKAAKSTSAVKKKSSPKKKSK